jgi:hypothetical protein
VTTPVLIFAPFLFLLLLLHVLPTSFSLCSTAGKLGWIGSREASQPASHPGGRSIDTFRKTFARFAGKENGTCDPTQLHVSNITNLRTLPPIILLSVNGGESGSPPVMSAFSLSLLSFCLSASREERRVHGRECQMHKKCQSSLIKTYPSRQLHAQFAHQLSAKH